MADRFHSINPEDIRLLSFDDNTIKVVLKSGQEATFEFETREALSSALLMWAGKATPPANPLNEVSRSAT
ncbi:MAG TPA: hypothetical protein VF773_23310 [Verrucomicrobiae bacterium]